MFDSAIIPRGTMAKLGVRSRTPSPFRSPTSACAGLAMASDTTWSSAEGSYGFISKTFPFHMSHATTSSFRSSDR